MMKKILGISASPRKPGNCEIMLKAVARSVPEKHELQLLRLADFDLRPCKGCYRCLFKEKKCILKDDIYTIIDAIAWADALILAVPTYFLGANAMLKLLVDRGLCFYGHPEKLWGKPSVGIGVAGIEGKEGATLLGIERFQRTLLADVKRTLMVYGALPGEVFMNRQNLETARQLGRTLFQPAQGPQEPCCPLCGSRTFRFLGANQVRCMLCSNTGTVDLASGTPVFSITKSGHDLFLNSKDALDHEKWLVGMKQRYLENKQALKEITRAYRGDGTWLKPEHRKL
jgi:multimeric flavodoxin WrbA